MPDNPTCPYCGTRLLKADVMIDVETMQPDGFLWHCPGCKRLVSSDQLADLAVVGPIFAMWLEHYLDGVFVDGASDGPLS